MSVKKVFIGNDHAGTDMKFKIMKYLESNNYEVVNVGTDDNNSCDYPIYAKKVCEQVLNNANSLGILICGTGIGMSISANKIKGIRASVVSDETSVRLTRLHNDANVLCFGARIVGEELAKDIVDAFLQTDFSKEQKHINRINQIRDLENE